MGRARQLADGGLNDAILMDASAADTDVNDNILLNGTDSSSTDAGFNLLYEDGTHDASVALTASRITVDSLNLTASTNSITLSGGGQIGSSTSADALSVSSTGVVTFSARDIHSSGITVADATQIGSASDTDAITIAGNGETTFSQDVTVDDLIFRDGGHVAPASDTDALSISSTGVVNIDASLEVAWGSYTPAIQIGDAAYQMFVAGGKLVLRNSTAGVELGSGGNSWGAYSDERGKDIIENIGDALTKVNSLRAVIGKYKVTETYSEDVLYTEQEWKPTGKNTGDVKNAKGSAKVGDDVGVRRSFLIAQDVKSVLPEAVDDSDADNLSLRYTDVIPLLVASIKELKTKVETLETKVATLEGGG